MAAEINLMSGGAPKEALAILIPRFEKLTGHHVKKTYAVIAALQQELAAGETPDMVLLPTSAVADVAKAGTLKSEGSRPFGTMRIVAIKFLAEPDNRNVSDQLKERTPRSRR